MLTAPARSPRGNRGRCIAAVLSVNGHQFHSTVRRNSGAIGLVTRMHGVHVIQRMPCGLVLNFFVGVMSAKLVGNEQATNHELWLDPLCEFGSSGYPWISSSAGERLVSRAYFCLREYQQIIGAVSEIALWSATICE